MSDKEESQPIKNLTTAFEEMFETAEAVKGEHFTELVGMILNASSLVKIIGVAVSDSLEAGQYVLADVNNPIRKTITRILHQNLSMFASAAGLSEEDVAEAQKFAEEMQKKIDQAEDELEDEE